MRILHIVNDAQTGGAQTLIEMLGLDALNSEAGIPKDELHLLVLLTPGALSPRYERTLNSVSYVNMSEKSVLPFAAIKTLYSLVRKHKIQIVHSHLLQSDLISLLTPLKIPQVSTLHTSGSHETSTVSRLVGRVVARLSRRFDAVVACSPSARSYALDRGYYKAANIPVIFNGISTSAPRRGVETVPAQHQKRLVILSRWHPMKDHATLFAALAIVRQTYPEFVVDCAGLDIEPQNVQLQQAIEAAGLGSNVRLCGSVQDVFTLLDGAAALVISSSHGEALPMAGIEALSAGVPVVTTDTGDCAALAVDPVFLVPPSDPARLAAALLRVMLADDKSSLGWKVQARELAVEKFDGARTARAYRSLYAQLDSAFGLGEGA